MKTGGRVATGSPGQMLVIFVMVCVICWTNVSAHGVEQSGTGYIIVDDSSSFQSAGQSIDATDSQLNGGHGYIRGHRYQLVSVGNSAGSGSNYYGTDDDGVAIYNGNTNGYSSQLGQQLSGVSARFLSVNAAAQTGSNNLGYQTQGSHDNGALGSSGRSGQDPGFEPVNGDGGVSGGHSSTQQDEEEDEEEEEEDDNDLKKTELQVDYSEEKADENLEIDLGNADDDTEEESTDVSGTTGRVAKAGYRRRRQKKMRPKVIIVKKIVPVSTTTYLYRG